LNNESIESVIYKDKNIKKLSINNKNINLFLGGILYKNIKLL